VSDGIRVVDGFLSPEACAAVLDQLRWSYWAPSTVVNRDPGGGLRTRTSGTRVSETTDHWWFSEPLQALVANVEERLREAFGLDPECLEPWQATRYGPGGTFAAHYDAGLWRDQAAGERTATVLLYLDQPEAGGGTEFPCLYRVVEPRPGRLLLWDNLRPDGHVDRLMRHASLPVERGRKTVLVTWGRERAARSPRGRQA
jgi:prolyl 4-hydroxylase